MKWLPGVLALLLVFADFAVPAAQAAKCDFVAGNIGFGVYDLLSTLPNVTSGTITVTCNPAVPQNVTVTLSPGQSGNFATRQMSAGGTDLLLYNIFTNAACTTVLGDGNGGSVSLSNAVVKNIPWNINYYGLIPSGQDVAAGLYSDLLTLTVDF